MMMALSRSSSERASRWNTRWPGSSSTRVDPSTAAGRASRKNANRRGPARSRILAMTAGHLSSTLLRSRTAGGREGAAGRGGPVGLGPPAPPHAVGALGYVGGLKPLGERSPFVDDLPRLVNDLIEVRGVLGEEQAAEQLHGVGRKTAQIRTLGDEPGNQGQHRSGILVGDGVDQLP